MESNPSPNSAPLLDCTVSVYSGNEPIFSFFSSAEVALATVRLTLADRCLYQASDLASQMTTLRREFQHQGKFPEALQEIMRIMNQFQVRVQSWEREVQNLERSKLEMSGNRMQRIRVEVSQVRGKIQMTDRVLAKLQIVLHQLEAEEAERLASESQREHPSPEAPIGDEEAAWVVEQFQEAVEALLGPGLVLAVDKADSESTNPSLRVQVWDQPMLIAVAAWHHGASTDRSMQRRLSVWLIPKFKDISEQAARIARSLRVQVVGSGSAQALEFHAACPLADTQCGNDAMNSTAGAILPQSQSTRQMLDRWIAKRFDRDRSKLIALCSIIPGELLRDGTVILKTMEPSGRSL